VRLEKEYKNLTDEAEELDEQADKLYEESGLLLAKKDEQMRAAAAMEENAARLEGEAAVTDAEIAHCRQDVERIKEEIADFANREIAAPSRKNLAKDSPAVKRGGRARVNAQSITEASFVTAEKSNKTKSAVPMYAFTPKNRQSPMPIITKKNSRKTSSSPRSRYFKTLRNNAFRATEKILAIKKRTAAITVFCVSASVFCVKEKGVTYS